MFSYSLEETNGTSERDKYVDDQVPWPFLGEKFVAAGYVGLGTVAKAGGAKLSEARVAAGPRTIVSLNFRPNSIKCHVIQCGSNILSGPLIDQGISRSQRVPHR